MDLTHILNGIKIEWNNSKMFRNIMYTVFIWIVTSLITTIRLYLAHQQDNDFFLIIFVGFIQGMFATVLLLIGIHIGKQIVGGIRNVLKYLEEVGRGKKDE